MVLYRSVSFLGAEEMHSETIALVLLSGSVRVWLHSVVVYNPDPFGAILCKNLPSQTQGDACCSRWPLMEDGAAGRSF